MRRLTLQNLQPAQSTTINSPDFQPEYLNCGTGNTTFSDKAPIVVAALYVNNNMVH